ncbi:hypothetical protein F4802DRAFT_593000 [Xylaria palmicola]|nr:hypothetical protein F4802DRAFT_593000 [Xylaria palmicola]
MQARTPESGQSGKRTSRFGRFIEKLIKKDKPTPAPSVTPDSDQSGKRTGGFGRFVKKLVKKDKPNPAPSVMPEEASSPNTRAYTMPQRQPNPTEEGSSASTSSASTSRPSTSSPSTRTYIRPRRNINSTEEDLNNHVTSLQAALNDAWPRRAHSPYKNVKALLVCWADNDPAFNAESPLPSPGLCTPNSIRSGSASSARPSVGTGKQACPSANGEDKRQGHFISAAHQLAGVLTRQYGIDSQVYLIPSLENPQDMLAGKVKHFVDEYGGRDNLLLFWYGGRAEFSGIPYKNATLGNNITGELIWHGLRDEQGVCARTITRVLGSARADVLMLNDSPFAQHAYIGHLSGPGTFELLGSGLTTASRDEPYPQREASFTRTLTLMLDSNYIASRGITTLDLHRKLLDIISPAHASIETVRASSSSPSRSVGSPLAPSPAPSVRTDGQHSSRTNRMPASPLVVARGHVLDKILIPAYPVYSQFMQAAPLEHGARRTIVLSRLGVPLGEEPNYARFGASKVRFEIRLDRPYLDVRRWREWALRAPGGAAEVSVKMVGKE